MNEFEKYEIDGRQKLKTVFKNVNWEFTKGQFDPYDAYANYKNKTVIAEIKTRNYDLYEYPNCFIEVKKLNNLLSNEADEIIYVSHFSNNVTATWNLTNLTYEDYTPKMIWMNKTTAGGIIQKIEKEVIELNIVDADLRITTTGKKREYLTANMLKALELSKENRK